MKSLMCGLAAIGASLGLANATTITFEEFGAGTQINTVSGVTFSSDAGVQVYQEFAQSGTKSISGAGRQYNADISVDFNQLVTDVMFWAGGDNNSGQTATIDIYNGATLLQSVALLTDGNLATIDMQDLSALGAMTRLVIRDVTDGFGLVYDDFKFTADAQVPVPAAALLFAPVLAGAALRKKRKA